MDNDTPRAGIIDRRIEEICAKVFTGIPPEERRELHELIEERIELGRISFEQSRRPCPHCGT